LRIPRILSLFCLLISVFTVAQQPKLTPPPTPPGLAAAELKVQETPHDLTAADVEAFLDGFMPMQLERENIAGAVICIVKDGKPFFAKGYGYSDVEKKTPISVDNTLFRPGSISKLFTWTAVMQLVEQGKLDLDRDINDYLDFKIPATFGKPITLRNLMTHTSGFEEGAKDLFIPEGSKLVPLKDYLVRHRPAQIFPPGEVPAYSNYGATLAGYIVERISGRAFNDYITDNIFHPLGMAHSTFAQPLPADLAPFMSKGYELGSGKAKPFEVLEPAPAGALTISAADIARFMIAHLQNGTLGDARILKPETALQMYTRQPGFNAALNGMALGFYEESRNGHRIIGHGGDTLYFHSDLHLIHDAGLGFYVSYNSAGRQALSPRSALWTHFLARYFAYAPPEPGAPASAASDAQSVSGYYLTSRRSGTNFLIIGNLFEEAQVIPNNDGTIKILPFKNFNGETRSWKEIGPLVYRDVNGQDRVAFQKDHNGHLEMRLNFPAVIYQRVSWFNSKSFNTGLLLFSFTILALAVLSWPVAALARRHYQWKLELTSAQRRNRRILRVVYLLDLSFAVLMLLTLSLADDLTLLSGKLDPFLLVIQGIGLLGAIGSLFAVFAGFRSVTDRALWTGARIGHLLIMLACIGFAWFVVHWNMINFNMNY
jgi:CubicO group peptidase (beta-lactamase class C family)